MNDIAPEYAESIDYYVVAFDETAATIQSYIDEQGYQGFIAVQPTGSMLADFQIVRQTSMLALNADGIIFHRQTIGNAAEWPPYLEALAADPHSRPGAGDREQEQEQRRHDLQLPS